VEGLPGSVHRRHGIQLALAIRKLAPEQNIVIHPGASKVPEQTPEELSDIRVLEKSFRVEELESLL
jgi:hypothetical protein